MVVLLGIHLRPLVEGLEDSLGRELLRGSTSINRVTEINGILDTSSRKTWATLLKTLTMEIKTMVTSNMATSHLETKAMEIKVAEFKDWGIVDLRASSSVWGLS